MAELAYGRVYAMNRLEARQYLIQTYQKTGSTRQTSRLVLPKWVRGYEQAGLEGLRHLSRPPASSPRKTPSGIEQQVLQAWQKTRQGRKRLALYLRTKGLNLSPHTIRHILRRVHPPQPPQRRKVVYPPR